MEVKWSRRTSIAALLARAAIAIAPKAKPNHSQLPHVDQMDDIAGIPLDHFWKKIEEFLPDDWWFTVSAIPDGGVLVYIAKAGIIEWEGDPATQPGLVSPTKETPERAAEWLFYALRDML